MNAAIFALVLASQVATSAEQPKASTTYVVHIAVREKPANGRGKILSEPNVVVTAGREANFHIGDNIHLSGIEVPTGTTIKLKVDPVGKGEVKVTGDILVTLASVHDNGIIDRESTGFSIAKTLPCEKDNKIRIVKTDKIDRWVELRIDEIKDGPAPEVRTTGYVAPTKN
jgi:hypothetical protein